MRIAYFTSNRTPFPPNPNQIAASSTITYQLISHLAEKHDITLYAAHGSTVPGVKIVDLGIPPSTIDASLAENDWILKASIGMKQLYLGEMFAHADDYDLIHVQTEPIYLAMPYTHLIKTPVLFTNHNTYHSFEKEIFQFYDKKIQLSALSQSQAAAFPMTQAIPVIYNGIEVTKYQLSETGGDDCLYFGRLHHSKGIDTFLTLAQQLSTRQFHVMGKGSSQYEEQIRMQPNITFSGMIAHESNEWFSVISNARVFVFPLQWEEPFGLTMIEAMACGTPVIAFARGSVPEIIQDGETGFIVNASDEDIRGEWMIKKTGIAGLKEAIERIYAMPDEAYRQMRRNCRMQVEKQFTVERMVDAYEKLYQQIIAQSK